MTRCLTKTLSASFFACLMFAPGAFAGNLTIAKAWVRPAVSGQQVTGAYMELTAKRPSKVVKIETPVADTVEIHRMAMKDGVMEMHELESLDLPAGETVRLHPGDYHLMLIDLKKPLKPGERVPLKITMQSSNGRSETVSIQVPVARAMR